MSRAFKVELVNKIRKLVTEQAKIHKYNNNKFPFEKEWAQWSK